MQIRKFWFSKFMQIRYFYFSLFNQIRQIKLFNLSKDNNMTIKKIQPIHPGIILQEEFLIPFGLSQTKLASDIGVSPRRINEIVLGKRAITADTALRLARYFNMSAQFWLGLQMDYELEIHEDLLAERLKTEVKKFKKIKMVA